MPAAKTLTKEELKAKGYLVVLDERDIEQPVVFRRNKMGEYIPVKFHTDKQGYLSFAYDNRTYLLQRVIYAWVNNICIGENISGEQMEVDHIDQNKKNNKPSNLRLVTHSENMKNMSARSIKPRDELSILKEENKILKELLLQTQYANIVEHLDRLVESNIDIKENDLWNENKEN